MGKNKKVKNNNPKEEIKNEVEVKEEKVVVKNEELFKGKEPVNEGEKKEQKEIKKEEKALIKKAKKAGNNDVKIIAGIIIAVVLVAFGIFGFYFYKINAESVATFDGGKVTASDYEVYYKTFAPMLEYYGYPASIIPEQIVNKAALDQIIVELAQKEGVTISEEDKQAVEEVFNDKEQVNAFVQQGIDLGKMKKLYLNDYLISAYLEKASQEISDEEVIEYIKSTNSENESLDLNQYNTSHILFKTTDESGAPLSDEEKEKKKQDAQAVLDRAKNGEDFATLAKEFSEDAGTKENDGKYTLYDDGNTMEEYANAAKSLKDGEIYATLVETDAGFHIIKLDSKVENGRAKNETERDECVDKKINSLAQERHLTVDNEALNKLVEKITGKKVEEEDTGLSDEVNATEDEATEETTSEENNSEEENTQNQ